MIKVLIVDDEARARNVLYHYILAFVPQITEIKVATSGIEAKRILGSYDPDLVFLDVEMPYQNGFDFLSDFPNPHFDIIFITGYNQYAIQAIRFSAFDYLLKPLDAEELITAVERFVIKREMVTSKRLLYENLLCNMERKDSADLRLAVPSSDGVFFFSISEILRLEADRNYTKIHLVNKRPFLASKTLKYFEETLEQFRFIRTHKSHLVNPEHIIRITSNHDFIVMADGARIEVSRRKKDEVQQLLRLR
jgi:two-component system, LytTR family, response regulator